MGSLRNQAVFREMLHRLLEVAQVVVPVVPLRRVRIGVPEHVLVGPEVAGVAAELDREGVPGAVHVHPAHDDD